RRDRHCHPARDRILALHSADPALARTGGGATGIVVATAGLLRHHRDPVAHWLDRPGARGAWSVSVAARGRLRDGRPPGWFEPTPHHRASHGAIVPQPHHRLHHARHSGGHPLRDGAILPRTRTTPTGDQLGRAAAG